MTRARWIALAVGVITVIITLLVLLVLETPAAPVQCLDADTRERVRKISLEAFDAALSQHMQHLFDVWVKDPDTQQPMRARTGGWAGISAYQRARQDTLQWNPPAC